LQRISRRLIDQRADASLCAELQEDVAPEVSPVWTGDREAATCRAQPPPIVAGIPTER
jgi:hypothetical protein